jgi:membrane dipeptidase
MRFALVLLVAGVACGQNRRVTDEEVRRVHGAALLIDTHNDIVESYNEPVTPTVQGFDIGPARPPVAKGLTGGHTDLPRLRAGGVGAVFFAAYVPKQFAATNQAANYALQTIDAIRHDIVERYPRDFTLAGTADDIVKAHKQGKIAALIGIEGGHAIEDSPRLLRTFYALGVRYLTLTHTNTNNWAGSSGDDKGKSTGLNALGREVVGEMNRLGMMVDISHVSDKTFFDVLETSKAPVIASHSSSRTVTPHARNLADPMIKALAKNGGVMQINFYCTHINQAGRAALADVVAHIDHAVKVGGIETVGIGSDYDGIECAPQGLEDVSKFPNLTRALLEKGYSEADIRKIYGENLLRVMRAVEAVAAKK